MKKRIFSLALALAMIFGACFTLSSSASNADETPLQFDKNGEFRVMHLCDCQDTYPASEKMIKFIDAALKDYNPHIVVLGGDNSVGPKETKHQAIKELCDVFVANETYFTLVFGNHDREQDVSNDELLVMYQTYGGKYCLAYDEVPALHGSATHNLLVKNSKGDKYIYNLWMFDSGSHAYDDAGNDLGYDCVREDQIQWYIDEGDRIAEEYNNGKKIPSLAFQHIIVPEVYDALFYESAVDLGELTRKFNGKIYSFFPKTENFEGFLLEYPCPGAENDGQFKAMVEQGDVKAVLSGHDHTNGFITEVDGVKIINTPGSTYHYYGSDLTRGMRMITVKEGALDSFETELVTVNDLAAENSDFAESAGVNVILGKVITVLGGVLLSLSKFSGIFSNLIGVIA